MNGGYFCSKNKLNKFILFFKAYTKYSGSLFFYFQ